jgi:hypothetical protein
MRYLKSVIGAGLLALGLALPAQAVSLGQIDTFEDGTTQNWVTALLGSPNPAPPVNVPTGGPAGVDDNFLLLTALGGNGPGSRLSGINLSQWAGDYLAAGVNTLRMDVNNLGAVDLSLRLMFADPMAGPPANVAFTDAILVPAGGGWTPISFFFSPASLISGLGDVTTALTNTTEIRLYHSPVPNFPNPVFPIPTVTAQLGVDNIQAQAVPEVPPGMLLSMGLGALPLLQRRLLRRSRRR